jgi:hypothetical protein
MQGDTAKAKAAYQDFLTLCKDGLAFRLSSLRKRGREAKVNSVLSEIAKRGKLTKHAPWR